MLRCAGLFVLQFGEEGLKQGGGPGGPGGPGGGFQFHVSAGTVSCSGAGVLRCQAALYHQLTSCVWCSCRKRQLMLAGTGCSLDLISTACQPACCMTDHSCQAPAAC